MEGSDNRGGNVSPQRQRFIFADRMNLLIGVVVGAAVLLVVVVAVILTKYSGPIQGANAAMTYRGVIAFSVVFLSYGVASVFLIVFFAYRILSPFKRLLIDMEEILRENVNKRLSLRDNDVYLVKTFVVGVNSLVDKLQQMRLVRDELISHIDAEEEHVLSLLEQDNGLSGKVREAVLSYHKKIVSIVKDKT
ncbi:hypothetical protein [Candidatus Magnetominusculus dajiuhuensis]|uniref:hypothetical protein n=1 Tax=Candidatus Magnetominusculus dajiuhuensis TaxID=3137712 RepID=UPI003B4360C9